MIQQQLNKLIIISVLAFLSACSSSNKCKNFFSYESKTLDIKGLSKKVKSKNENTKEINVGTVTIKKDIVEVGERLKELDLLQFSLCSQLNSFTGNQAEKNILIAKNSETIREMLKIAQQSTDLPQEQQNRLLIGYKQELLVNLQTLDELLKNVEIILRYTKQIADTTGIRNKKINLLSLLFPFENIKTNPRLSPRELAQWSMTQIAAQKLTEDSLEMHKFNLVSKSIAMTIDKTINTLKSLSDSSRLRYIIIENFWTSNLDQLRRISDFDVAKFQLVYPQMKTLRNSYDVVYSRGIDYLISLRNFFSPKDGIVNFETLDRVLTSERFAIDLIANYSIELASQSKKLKELVEGVLSKTLDSNISKSQNGIDNSDEAKKKIEKNEVTNGIGDIAVIATTNEKQDHQLARILGDWLKNSGVSSQSILKNLFIEQELFNQIIDRNSSLIKSTNVANAAKYVCLVRSKVEYVKSEINDALFVATCNYEGVIIETATGKNIDSFKILAKSSGITKEMAKQRAESDFINDLNKIKTTF